MIKDASDPLMPSHSDKGDYGIDVYWLPLGAGGWFVRLNGLIYEAILARRENRPQLDLYHSALEVRLPEGRFVIENAWPIPDAKGVSRGVVVEGPVWNSALARLRVFRYEVRRWRDGRIPDVAYAIESPRRVSDDIHHGRRLLDLVPHIPPLKWGRDELRIGDMWNSNSVVSWLLAGSGLPAEQIHPPRGGRAPGWKAGLELAHSHQMGFDLTRADPAAFNVERSSPECLGPMPRPECLGLVSKAIDRAADQPLR